MLIPLLLLFSSVKSVVSLSILMFVPTLSYSHVSFSGKIADILTENGHNVVMLLPEIDETVTNNGSNTAKIIRRDVSVTPMLLQNTLWRNPGPFENSNPLNPRILMKLLIVSDILVNACQALSKDESLISELEEHRFDVAIVEQYDWCGFGLFSALQIPSTIWLSATGLHSIQPETLGVRQPLSYVPDLFSPHSDDMTICEKIKNMAISKVTTALSTLFSRRYQEESWRKRGILKDGNTLEKKAAQSSAVIVNSRFPFDFPSPTSSQFLFIGGFSVDRNPPELNSKWQKIASDAPFVIVSFGSIARTSEMPFALKNAFFESFKFFPNVNFIVKYENMEGVRRWSDNVILSRWIPQNSLMAHSNFSAIITHGGWSSILESISFARPLILMPLFADHAKNSKVVESKGVGLVIDKMTVTTKKLVESIERILTDEKIHERCVLFSRILRSSPLSQSALIEYVVRRSHREWRFRRLREEAAGGNGNCTSSEGLLHKEIMRIPRYSIGTLMDIDAVEYLLASLFLFFVLYK